MKAVLNSDEKNALSPLGLPWTLSLDKNISFRLYRDTRPHCLEISALHKGLVLVFKGYELIEEGAGFGCPVVKYHDKPYFSTSAETSIRDAPNGPILTKRFHLDAVSRKTVGRESYVNDSFYSFFHRIFEINYLSHKSLVSAFNAMMMVRKLLKVNTQFVRAEPRGIIAVEYEATHNGVEVTVDLSGLNKTGCEEILILNEQGSTFFREFTDSNGLVLRDRKIGAWDVVTAHDASLSDAGKRLAFRLQNLKGARLFRGWEKTVGRFAWSGLGYSVSPSLNRFSYSLEFQQSPRQ